MILPTRNSAIHPFIKLLTVLAIMMSLPFLGLSTMIPAWFVGIVLLSRLGSLPIYFSGVFRMKYLLLSIAVLYLGFTPGRLIVPSIDWLTIEGLVLAGQRCFLLLLLLALVYLLTQSTTTSDLARALAWLMKPLSFLGVDVDRQAMRISAVLDTVTAMQEKLARERASIDTASSKSLLDRFASTIASIEVDALSASHERQAIPQQGENSLQVVPAIQWCLPVLVPAVLLLLNLLLSGAESWSSFAP